MTQEMIDCKAHGQLPYSITCKHLIEQAGLGYFAIEAEDDDPAQVWCEECDAVLAQEKGWTDTADAQAGWKLVCAACCADILETHTLVSWVEGKYPDE